MIVISELHSWNLCEIPQMICIYYVVQIYAMHLLYFDFD